MFFAPCRVILLKRWPCGPLPRIQHDFSPACLARAGGEGLSGSHGKFLHGIAGRLSDYAGAAPCDQEEMSGLGRVDRASAT